MRVIETVAGMRRLRAEEPGSIGFVPTMGYLHEGHLSLARRARQENDLVVASIFVNPTQFGPNEDFARYPRDPERDLAMLTGEKVDVVFMPPDEEMYPTGFNTTVEVGGVTEKLEGASRPGHFKGVTTVVNKLFNIVQPNWAYFGQKDAQQAIVIRKMVSDLDMNVEVVVMPTMREEDGLALSSRNVYLSPDERKRALCISLGLFAAEAAFLAGDRDIASLLTHATECLWGVDELQYCELVDAQNLEPLVGRLDRTAAICVAAYVGSTRLIDNILLNPN